MRSIKVLIKFSAENADMPLAWTMATRFSLKFSILQADILSGQGGRMIMDLEGDADSLDQALEYVRSLGIGVTILSRSIAWDNDVCVHCGACTAVCTRKALSLNPVTAELQFDNALCTVCEMCTHACPTGAMHMDFYA